MRGTEAYLRLLVPTELRKHGGHALALRIADRAQSVPRVRAEHQPGDVCDDEPEARAAYCA